MADEKQDLIVPAVKMVDGKFKLPPEALAGMANIRKACQKYAIGLMPYLTKENEREFLDFIRRIQALKDVACQAFILPYADVEPLPTAEKIPLAVLQNSFEADIKACFSSQKVDKAIVTTVGATITELDANIYDKLIPDFLNQ